MLRPALRVPLLLALLIGLAAVAASQIEPAIPGPESPLESRPEKVMSTSALIIAVPPEPADDGSDLPDAARALAAAEAVLREVETQMSVHIEASPVSRFNRAPVDQAVVLPAGLLEVLRASQQLYLATDRAFDVTCGPVLELWRTAKTTGRVPDRAAVSAARRESSWSRLLLTPTHATRRGPRVGVDLGGIAKGHAIDRAVVSLREAGMAGGLVDVGGDLRVFGRPPRGEQWEVRVQNPLGEGTIVTLSLPEGAVCTSGSYHRYTEIDGKRYSHIVDPRTGWSIEGVASVTVLAADAMTADAWATALSVLGPKGLDRLPEHVDALLVVGDEHAPRAIATPDFKAKIQTGPPYPLEVRNPSG